MASNLVANDTNNVWDIFVHDRQTGLTERVSVASDGTQGNDDSGMGFEAMAPQILDDGRYVAFDSEASNLVTGDTNNSSDIFVHDRTTGQAIRISTSADGTQANRTSAFPAMSADGLYVAFQSSATNLMRGSDPSYPSIAYGKHIVFPPYSPPQAAPMRNVYDTLTPTLSWGGVSWAKGYEVQVDDDPNFGSPGNAALVKSPICLWKCRHWSRACRTTGACARLMRRIQPGMWSAVDEFVIDLP